MMTSQFRLLLVETVSGVLGRDCDLEGGVLFSECPFEQPADNREVPPLVVGRENDGVLVLFRSHFDQNVDRN